MRSHASASQQRRALRPQIGPTGLALWHIPGSTFQIMWAGPGSKLRFGRLTEAGGVSTSIKHPSADATYDTLRDATEAVGRFMAAAKAAVEKEA